MKRALASVVAGIWLTLLAIGPVAAVENVFDTVTVGPVTQVAHDASPTVTVSWHCLADYPFMRVRLTLTQRDSSSTQTGAGSCVAGQTVSQVITFGPQQGTFHPGPASYQGFVTTLGGAPDQVISIAPTETRIRR